MQVGAGAFGLSSDSLAGRSMVVAGGSAGIGLATASRLVADGATVTVGARRRERLDAAGEIIRAAARGHGRVRMVAGDLTRDDDVAALIRAAGEHGGGLDGLVCCVGRAGPIAPLHEQQSETVRDVLDSTLVSVFTCLRHAIPAFIQRGGGSFVAVSSVAAAVSIRYLGPYTVAKAGVECLVRNAANEYGERGIRINAVRPGFVETERLTTLIPPDSPLRSSFLRNTPMGGVAWPADIADSIRYLIGPESGWVTGAVLNVDGGQALRGGPDYSSRLSTVKPVHGEGAP